MLGGGGDQLSYKNAFLKTVPTFIVIIKIELWIG